MNEIVIYKSFKDIKNTLISEKFNILAVLVVFLVLFIISFNKWGELILFDNAREIVVPLLMSKGLSLYGDIYYFYSPLIPYFFLLMIAIFGFHMSIFYATGIVVSVVYGIVLYLLARCFLNRFCSTIVVTLFFIQLVFFNTGIFSYIYPYSYAAIIGSLVVSLMTLILLVHFNSGDKKYIYYAAVCCMVALLLKQDFFITCMGVFILYLFLIPVKQFNDNKFFTYENFQIYKKEICLKELIISSFFIIVIPVLICSLLAFKAGFKNVLQGIFPFELFMLKNPATEIFVRDALRSVPVWANISDFFIYGIIVALLIIFTIVIIYLLIAFYKKYSIYKLVIACLLLLVLSLLCLFLFPSLVLGGLYTFVSNLHNVYAGFNLWLVLLICYYLYNIKDKKSLKPLILSLIALSLNYRMFYVLALKFYSFYYLPISLIIFVYLLYYFVPGLVLKRINLSLSIWKWAVSIFLVIYSLVYFLFLAGLYNLKSIQVTTRVGISHTRENIAPKYSAINEASEFIRENTTKDDKILIYPSFLIMYLFTDRLPASRYYYLVAGTTNTPEEEQQIIEDIKRNKPKFIVIHNNEHDRLELDEGVIIENDFSSADSYKTIFDYVITEYTLVKNITRVVPKIADKKVVIDVYQLNTTIK